MANNLELIKEMAAPLLEPGERVLGAMIAAPKGRTTAMVGGGAASMIGFAQTGKVIANAKEVGLLLYSPMALVVTPQRVLTVKIKISSIGPIKLECRVGLARELVETFESAKASG
jgi:hypothetical protein